MVFDLDNRIIDVIVLIFHTNYQQMVCFFTAKILLITMFQYMI